MPSCCVVLSAVFAAIFASGETCAPYPTGQLLFEDPGANQSLPGDALTFTFTLTFDLQDSVNNVQLSFTGFSLKFPSNQTAADVITWELVADNGNRLDRNSSSLEYTETLAETLADDKLYTLEFPNLEAGVWRWEGAAEMKIEDDAGAGDQIQSTVHLQYTRVNDNITYSTSVASEYFYLPPPLVWLNGQQGSVPLMGLYTAELNVGVQEPQILLNSRMEFRTPSEESSREVILTIQSMSTPELTGFNDRTLADVISVYPTLSSTFGSFQDDVARADLPPLYRDVTNASTAELRLPFVTRAEDFSQLRDGDVVIVEAGLQFGTRGGGEANGVFIWVGAVSVTLQAPAPENKRPVLSVEMVQKASCAYDGETRASVEVRLEHDSSSTATAYNLTAHVYLSGGINISHHSNSELRENSLAVSQQGSVVSLDLARMTFSDPTSVTLDLDIDLSDPRVMRAQHHVITAEAGFSDRWGNSSGMITNMTYVSLRLPKECSKRLTWSTGGHCPCAHNVSQADCACCMAGACQCGALNPALCLPCETLDNCRPFLDGFDAITELPTGTGSDVFLCDAYHRYRPWSSGVSCYKKFRKGDSWMWSVINPLVGAITERDEKTGTLYGISNNGLARMRSDDAGVTWYSIRPSDYEKARAAGKIVNATRLYGLPDHNI